MKKSVQFEQGLVWGQKLIAGSMASGGIAKTMQRGYSN